MNRRSSRLGPTLALLLLFAACLASREGGEGCACRREPPTTARPQASTLALEPPGAAPVPGSAAGATEADEGQPAPATELEVALPDFADPLWTRVPSRAGRYLVCWRSLGGQVPRNQDFELEVWVLHAGKPVRDALLGVSAWMPDHGHGMLRQVRPEARGDGSFRVEGMLLHMRGHWLLRFDVLEDTLSETAECALDL